MDFDFGNFLHEFLHDTSFIDYNLDHSIMFLTIK